MRDIEYELVPSAGIDYSIHFFGALVRKPSNQLVVLHSVWSSLSMNCVTCGACCATFRVSFYWTEADPFNGGTVPSELTSKVSPHFVAMNGTNQPAPRCVALSGEIGQQVSCDIYEKRSSTCREFEAGSVDCLKARLKHGITDDVIPIQVA